MYKGRIGFAASPLSRDLKKTADFAVRHGFGLAQLNLDYSYLFPENMPFSKRDEIRRYYAERRISSCFHGPSDIPLLNRHSDIRDAGLKRMFDMLDLAIDLGGEYFIFHPGRLAFYSIGKNEITFMENRFPAKHADFLKTSLEKILKHASNRITVCVENTYHMPPIFRDIFSSLSETHDLKFAWDVAYTEALAARGKAVMLKFFNDNIRKVKIAHFHDFTETGAHKMLGSGLLNVSAYLEIISLINADIILEIFPENDLLESLKYINDLVPKLDSTR